MQSLAGPSVEPDAEPIAATPIPSDQPPLAIREAIRALRGRATISGSDVFLNRQIVTVPDLIRAAIAAGADIRYPGIRPARKAFHCGPSMALGGTGRTKDDALDAGHSDA